MQHRTKKKENPAVPGFTCFWKRPKKQYLAAYRARFSNLGNKTNISRVWITCNRSVGQRERERRLRGSFFKTRNAARDHYSCLLFDGHIVPGSVSPHRCITANTCVCPVRGPMPSTAQQAIESRGRKVPDVAVVESCRPLEIRWWFIGCDAHKTSTCRNIGSAAQILNADQRQAISN